MREGLSTLFELNPFALWKLYPRISTPTPHPKKKITDDIAKHLSVAFKEVEKITVEISWFRNCIERYHETF